MFAGERGIILYSDALCSWKMIFLSHNASRQICAWTELLNNQMQNWGHKKPQFIPLGSGGPNAINPIAPYACAGVLPGGANHLCSCASSQKGRALSRFQEGLFPPVAGVAQDGWGYSIQKPNRGWAKACVEHPCMDLDLFVLCWNGASTEVGWGQ